MSANSELDFFNVVFKKHIAIWVHRKGTIPVYDFFGNSKNKHAFWEAPNKSNTG
jgi:hypothetical protein